MSRFANDLENLDKVFMQKFGQHIYPNNCIVVATDGAYNLMRELQVRVHPKIAFDPDQDVLFRFDGAPVRLRHNAIPGQAIVMAHHDVPNRRCCDETAMASIMIALSRGNA